MKSMKISQRSHDNECEPAMTVVREELMRTLALWGPMPIEELVEQLPHFRWVDVLKAVSWLWGKGRLELEHDSGGLRIWSLEKYETTRYVESKAVNRSKNGLELTIS